MAVAWIDENLFQMRNLITEDWKLEDDERMGQVAALFVQARLDHARDWMLMLGQMSAIEKVSTLLLSFSEKIHRAQLLQGISSEEDQFELPLTRSEMADFLGLTIETVSRQFSILKKRGLIDISRKRFITILDRATLKAISEQESL